MQSEARKERMHRDVIKKSLQLKSTKRSKLESKQESKNNLSALLTVSQIAEHAVANKI